MELRSKVIGTGRPFVFLHAFPLSHELFDDWSGIEGFELILPDFPGFGLTPLYPEEPTLDRVAEALAEHLKHMGIHEKIVLGGISMGGYWAFEFLRLYPEMVGKLLLASTRPGPDKPEGRAGRLTMADRVLQQGTEFMVDAMTPALLGKTTLAQGDRITGRLAQWIRVTRPEAVAGAQRAMAQRRDQTEFLTSLQVPTLILAGAEDTLIPPAEAHRMKELIPNSQLVTIEKAGHLLPLEAPRIFQSSIESFVRSSAEKGS
ncbi:MAG TPA: alpha/beta hydrolase [bacterium]|nr:alpha/beta hydrolase [bacterium]